MALEPVSQVAIDTATDDPRERRTADKLRDLLDRLDVSGLQWTTHVRIEHWIVPHSHPVLTLNTRVEGDDLLSTYLHEQLHWWTAEHPAFGAAVADTSALWPDVPIADAGGAADEHSTRLHLIVCHLERRAMQQVVGGERSSATLQRQIDGQVYPWVYGQIRRHADELDRVCTVHGLWPDRLVPAA